MNSTDDPCQTPRTITLPVMYLASSSDEIRITVPPYTAASTFWPIAPLPEAPSPRRQFSPKDKAGRKAKRKQATLSRRRNR